MIDVAEVKRLIEKWGRDYMVRTRLMAPPRFRPANDSLPVAVPARGEHARGGQGLVSGWVADMQIEVSRLEVFR